MSQRDKSKNSKDKNGIFSVLVLFLFGYLIMMFAVANDGGSVQFGIGAIISFIVAMPIVHKPKAGFFSALGMWILYVCCVYFFYTLGEGRGYNTFMEFIDKIIEKSF
ncbi:MAG: hypothetical protein GQ570_05285 [Helicobacteraceae bacterium]|nr:hypothetical protein [Helicobacteraceae bacterium]